MYYHYSEQPLFKKYSTQSWFNDIVAYLMDRYSSVEERLVESFRYVSCDSKNQDTFSYEYSSILRDSGSIFGSAMDKFLEKTGTIPTNAKTKQYSIIDYKKWLVENVPDIPILSIEIRILRNNRYLIPFSALANPATKICWWDAHNDLKHSDMDYFEKGNLQNAINGLASVAGLFILMFDGNPSALVRMYENFGYREPMDEVKALLFCQS